MFDAVGKGHLILHGAERMQNQFVFRNGDGSEAIIPADLLPESQRDGRQMVDTVDAIKHLVQRVRELEVVEESLARNLADTALCPLCLIKDCPQYGKGDLGMGVFEPELVDREQCKKSIIAHARKGAKEFVYGQRKD